MKASESAEPKVIPVASLKPLYDVAVTGFWPADADGKLHVCVGDADSFYLDRAVHLLQDFMETTTEPYYRGTFDFGQRKPHCYAGSFDPKVGLNQHYLPEMVKHMAETAPKGADLGSWKY